MAHGTRAVDPVVEQLLADALRLWREHDLAAAVEHLARHDDPRRAMDVYHRAVVDLYWQHKDVAGAVAFGRAGTQFGLTVAARAAGDAALIADLRGAAKACAYNVGSFTWPGWDEPGVALAAADVAAGLDAARTNLRLAVELNRPAKAVGQAHWLVGAHLLADEQPVAARDSFTTAAKCTRDSGASGMLELLYVSLAELLIDPRDPQRVAAYDATIGQAREVPDGTDAAAQVQTARRVFDAHHGSRGL